VTAVIVIVLFQFAKRSPSEPRRHSTNRPAGSLRPGAECSPSCWQSGQHDALAYQQVV